MASVRPDDLAAHIIKAVVERSGIDPALIEDVYFGATNQAGEDNRNVARMAALLAGLPASVPGSTVNRLCASGLEAVNIAARMIEANHGDVFIAGGVGVTPMLSMLRTLADRSDRRRHLLIVSAGREADFVLRQQVAVLRRRLALSVVEVVKRPPRGWI